jgi:hypothetical protein
MANTFLNKWEHISSMTVYLIVLKNHCGLCLCPAPMCQLYLRKYHGTSANVSVEYNKLSCVHLIHFNYMTASTSSEASPCSNVPISCPLCPAGSPVFWTYSLYAHFQGRHHLQLPAHFPIKVSLLQSEIDGMQNIWHLQHKFLNPPISNQRNKQPLPSQKHIAHGSIYHEF